MNANIGKRERLTNESKMGPKWSNIGPKVHGEAKSGLGQMGTFCASWKIPLSPSRCRSHSSEKAFGLLENR